MLEAQVAASPTLFASAIGGVIHLLNNMSPEALQVDRYGVCRDFHLHDLDFFPSDVMNLN